MYTEKQQWAIERTYHWWNVANDAHHTSMDNLLFIDFSNRMTVTAGLAITSKSRIVFSNPYLNKETEASFDQVIGHEVAHVFADKFYQRRCKHSIYWQTVMRNMGLKPDRCHQYARVVPKRNIIKLIITCPVCNIAYRFPKSRIIHLAEGTRTYCCHKCDRIFEPSDPITVRQPCLQAVTVE